MSALSDSKVTRRESLVYSRQLPNGLALVVEPMAHVQSAAFSLVIPAGAAHEPHDRGGIASMTAEWIMRGAGDRDNRELVEALDNLGVNHGESASTSTTSIAAATLSRNLIAALEIFADVVLRPRLDEEEFEPIQELARQSLMGLEDSPDSKAMVELRKRFYPSPWGRCASGDMDGIQNATPADLRRYRDQNYSPNGAVLGIAGAVDWVEIQEAVERLFGSWEGPERSVLSTGSRPVRQPIETIIKDTKQTQIAMAFPSVNIKHPEYYQARAAAAILGGYSSSRLFTEVREKRGLCYSVSAGYESIKDHASIVCHAGSAPERAQQTLDVMFEELNRLRTGSIDLEELDTMRACLKTALIMQQESSMSRASSIAADWHYLQRVRTLDEISRAVDELSPNVIVDHAQTIDFQEATVLTLGPNPLALPEI